MTSKPIFEEGDVVCSLNNDKEVAYLGLVDHLNFTENGQFVG